VISGGILDLKPESRYVRKAEELFREAKKDLDIGCFNKAVSTFYFSIESLANAILFKYGQRVRGFRGRINTIAILVSKKVAKDMLYLYELRVLADHKEDLMSKEMAYGAFKIAEKLYSELKRFLER